MSAVVEAGQNAEAPVSDAGHARRSLILRWILAGPVALVAAILTMAAMPMWLPQGEGGVNHLAFSVVLFPAIWAVYLMYVLLEERMKRAAIVMSVLVLANAIPVALTVMKLMASMQSGGEA